MYLWMLVYLSLPTISLEVTMKERNKTNCPLEESWHHQYCLLHAKHKENDTFNLCMHQATCQSYKSLIDFNRSQLEAMTKMFKSPSQ